MCGDLFGEAGHFGHVDATVVLGEFVEFGRGGWNGGGLVGERCWMSLSVYMALWYGQ